MHAMKRIDLGYLGFGGSTSRGSKLEKSRKVPGTSLTCPREMSVSLLVKSLRAFQTEATEKSGMFAYRPPRYWFGFQGLEGRSSLLMNVQNCQ